MKIFIFILLISYIFSLTTNGNQLLNLPLYGSISYNGSNPSLSILDISGYEDDEIYISYYIRHNGFDKELLNYSFTDNYPDEYFKCTNQTKLSYSSYTASGSKKQKHKKVTSVDYYFAIKKENKKYLVLQNLLYRKYTIEVSHHKINPYTIINLLVILFFVLFITFGIVFIYTFYKHMKRVNSESIDFKKEEPSPLYPPTETYDSTQANTTPVQQPPLALQPIPPEVANTNDTWYSSGMDQQDGYSSGKDEQGYYSGMAYQS